VGKSSIGISSGRDGAGNGGVMGDHGEASDTGDDSTVGLTSGNLSKSVGLSIPLAIVNIMMKSRDGSGVVQGGGGVADNRGGSNNGPVSGAVTSVDEGQGSTVGLTSSDLTKGVGLSLPLAIDDSMVNGDTGGVVNRGGGIADNRGGGNRGVMGDNWDASDTGDDSAVGLSSGNLEGGVGLSLPLSIVDAMVKGRYSSGIADDRGGIVEGNTADLGHASLGGVGDDTDVVKTTLSQGILSWGTSGHLGHGPGLGIPRDSHDGQAENERFHG